MKNYLAPLLLILTLSSALAIKVFACGDTQNQRSPETDTFHCFGDPTTITKTIHWRISWLDGYDRDVDVTDHGQLGGDSLLYGCTPSCWPDFENPYFQESGSTAYWFQNTYPASIGGNGQCQTGQLTDHRQGHTCGTPRTEETCELNEMYWNFSNNTCQDTPWYCDQVASNCSAGHYWSDDTCRCEANPGSPIVVDVTGNGFDLTDTTGGARFDLNNDGHREKLS